ncbi:MAG: UDP-N-acetylglucosamine 1-carboxyvinyltransferase [Candidatus Omnitrophota bacterium]|nr:UDP-N-acetylglucosamine 1-carboxyvinyltransferase [Candidatus Omnitrophota bacterium]
MDKLIIEGKARLKGEVSVSGAKNSVLPILAATLLTDEECRIENCPNLRDTHTMIKLLRSLGKNAELNKNTITVTSKGKTNYIADYKLVSTMRGSFCVLGPLLAKLKMARVSLPGGCIIGVRPVDLHLKGMRALGAKINVQGGYVEAKANSLKGNHIYLGGIFGSSVLATANVMMAASLAKGKTTIESAACEPELVDLANFLNKMGAKIKGQGSPKLEIEGVKELHGTEYNVIPDRIEAGTFLILSAITRGDITIKDVCWEHLSAIIDKLEEAGFVIEKTDPPDCRAGCKIQLRVKRKINPVNVTTLPYPGFPTDLQSQFMTLMAVTPGVSVITEKVFPDRFIHIAELNRMGAKIMREGASAIIEGVKQLSAAPVMASDLRASAALVLAGLVAKGRTEISRIYHLERGYENLDEKLTNLGARVWREKE